MWRPPFETAAVAAAAAAVYGCRRARQGARRGARQGADGCGHVLSPLNGETRMFEDSRFCRERQILEHAAPAIQVRISVV